MKLPLSRRRMLQMAMALAPAAWLISRAAPEVIAAAALAGAFVIWRHRANIARLRAGTEHVFTFGGKQ